MIVGVGTCCGHSTLAVLAYAYCRLWEYPPPPGFTRAGYKVYHYTTNASERVVEIEVYTLNV